MEIHRLHLQRRYETKESTIRFFFEQNGAANRIQVKLNFMFMVFASKCRINDLFFYMNFTVMVQIDRMETCSSST